MIHVDWQKMAAPTYRHDTSRDLDPRLHTHCAVVNIVRGTGSKWRTTDDGVLYLGKTAIGVFYRMELVIDDSKRLTDRLEKTTGERVTASDAANKYVVLGVDRAGTLARTRR